MFTKRLIFIFGVALSCAILASVLVVKYVHTREEEAARAKIDLQPVVIATSDIPVGAHLDATLVSLRDWPKSGMPQGALVEPEAVPGPPLTRVRRFSRARATASFCQSAPPPERGGKSSSNRPAGSVPAPPPAAARPRRARARRRS